MVKKMPLWDGNELEDPGCLLRQLEDAAPVVRSVTSLYFTQMQIRRGVYSRAAFISLSASNCAALIRGRRLFEGGVYSRKYGRYCHVGTHRSVAEASLTEAAVKSRALG